MQWVRESSAGEPQAAPAGSETESPPVNGSPQEAEQPRKAAAEKEAAPSPWPALYQWLAAHPCSGDAVDLVRFRAWRALGYVNAAELDPAVARQLFPAPLKAGVSQLEAHRNCPFQHFLRYGLCLSERGHERVTARTCRRSATTCSNACCETCSRPTAVGATSRPKRSSR